MAALDFKNIPEFYHPYLHQVVENDLATAFRNNTVYATQFFSEIDPSKYDYCYAAGKWSIKEIVQHITDSERIFSYRALRFARKDNTPLPGFDENLFALNAKAHVRNWDNLIEEFFAVRKATDLLFHSFDEQQLETQGVANKATIYVLAIGFICVGHCRHHLNILKERYL